MSLDEWDQRVVCPDGACIGVIGPDGLCKVCGRVAPNWGDERNRGLVDGDEDADEDEDADVDDESEAGEAGEAGDDGDEATGIDEPHDSPEADVSAYEWSRRTLCPDGACLGVIAANGKCTVCGKAAA